jgi:exonuclease III
MPNEQNLLLPKMSGFKLASLNVTSLVKHIEELRILLANNMIDVLAINETRLDSTVSKSSTRNKKKDVVVIAGDSLVKNMVGAYMSKDDVGHHYVVNHSFLL